MAEETIFLQDGDITITNARAVLGSKTYAMANITSVSTGVIPAKRGVGIFIAILGGVIMISGFAGHSSGWGIFGILILAAGIGAAYSQKDSFVVKIGSSSGESDALSSTNKEKVQKIVSAINEAIIKRG